MDQNPYESPRDAGGNHRPHRNFLGLRRKPWWGYAIAFVVGVFSGALILGPPLAALDDAGGIQMLIGGFLGLYSLRLAVLTYFSSCCDRILLNPALLRKIASLLTKSARFFAPIAILPVS